MLDAIVAPEHLAIGQHDLTRPFRQVSIQKSLHRAMVIRQAKVLAFRFIGGA